MKTIIVSLKIFLFLTILTGIIYPLLITGIALIAFPDKANGSLVFIDNKAAGSELIGQSFDSTIYFSSRPSAASYNPLPSGGSNFGLSNSKMIKQVSERKSKFLNFNSLDSLTVVPSEMLFASASGLDPHISKEAALLQVNRVAGARNLNSVQKDNLVQTVLKFTEKPQFKIFGEERINVLLLNIELDKISGKIPVKK
jgi:potassium-transporting ATPase KdpC subunit